MAKYVLAYNHRWREKFADRRKQSSCAQGCGSGLKLLLPQLGWENAGSGTNQAGFAFLRGADGGHRLVDFGIGSAADATPDHGSN